MKPLDNLFPFFWRRPFSPETILLISLENVSEVSLSYGHSYGAKFKLLYSEKILFYSEKHFHIQRKLYYIQRNIFIFSVIFLYLKKFSIFREIAYLKKLSTFRESFYIYRNCIYSEECFFIQRKCWYLKKSVHSEKT